MKKTIKVFGFTAFIAVIAFSMAALTGCDDGSGGGGGGGGITYTVEAKDTPTERIKFYFNGSVTDLQRSDITVTNGTGAVTVVSLGAPYESHGETTYELFVTPTQSGTVKVKVTKDGIEAGEKTITVQSGNSGGTNSDKVATPTASPAGGTYTSAQNVTLTSATTGATIRYTLDETNPTSTTGTVYSAPITITEATTIKAIAYKTDMTDSDILTAAYTISGGNNNNDPAEVPGEGLAAKLQWLKTNVQSNNDYLVTVNNDEELAGADYTSSVNNNLEYKGKSNVTIRLAGSGAERTISLSSNGSLFYVRKDVTLVLDENITLRGKTANNGSLVWVEEGRLVMNEGAKITGNITSEVGGGVCVVGGTFTMNGGTISGNTSTGGSGGGVHMNGGTFTMTDGTISGNTASDSLNNLGGGVYMDFSGTFTKTGGTITGYADDPVNGNVVKNSSDTVQNNRGHAVLRSANQRRELTAGPTDDLDSTKDGAEGGWEN